MRKLFYIMALVTALTLPLASQASAAGMYITPKFLDSLQNTGGVGGSSGLSSQTWNSLGGALAVGTNLRDYTDTGAPLRFEFEYATRANTESQWNGNLGARQNLKAAWQVQTFQVNGYWDIDIGSSFVPYVGAGIGASYIYESLTSGPIGARHNTEGSNWGLAWNVGAGVAWNFADNMALDLQYRFAGFGESTLKHYGSDVSNYMTANEFMAGLRVSF